VEGQPLGGSEKEGALTDAAFWDAHWEGLKLPTAVDERRASPYQREILGVFKRFAPRDHGGRALEIGGAPGGYLAYIARTFGLEAHAIDSSPVGCRLLAENFRLLDIAVSVQCVDALSADLSGLPRFDLVYSLGLIEHFDDPVAMIRKHIELARPGGIVVLGLPAFLGINRPILRLTRPELFSTHNMRTMDLRTWSSFEHELGVDVLFRDYVGGWEPRIYAIRSKGRASLFANGFIWGTAKLMDMLGPLRGRNARAWSGYAMAVYRTRTPA
jgi:SAM-dependent methyltransferase